MDSGTIQSLCKMFAKAYGDIENEQASHEAYQAKTAVLQVRSLIQLLPPTASLAEMFRSLHQHMLEQEGESARVQHLRDTFTRTQVVLDSLRSPVVSMDLESVKFAEIALYMAIDDRPGPFEIQRGDDVSARFRGSVLTAHFDNGLSLELSLMKGASKDDCWRLDGGLWPRNAEAQSDCLYPSVDVTLPPQTKASDAIPVVKRELDRLMRFFEGSGIGVVTEQEVVVEPFRLVQ